MAPTTQKSDKVWPLAASVLLPTPPSRRRRPSHYHAPSDIRHRPPISLPAGPHATRALRGCAGTRQRHRRDTCESAFIPSSAFARSEHAIYKRRMSRPERGNVGSGAADILVPSPRLPPERTFLADARQHDVPRRGIRQFGTIEQPGPVVVSTFARNRRCRPRRPDNKNRRDQRGVEPESRSG